MEQLFLNLYSTLVNKFDDLTLQLVNKTISLDEWYNEIASALHEANRKASAYGGGRDTPNFNDDKLAEEYTIDQLNFLDLFKEDIQNKDPRYINSNGEMSLEGILYRIQLYPKSIRLPSIRSWLKGISSSVEIYWIITAMESCKDCPYVADGSPYTTSTLYLIPGDGTTECKMNCKCILQLKDGTRCFNPL